LSTRLEPATEINWEVTGQASLDRLLNYLYGPDLSILSMRLLYIESQIITIALKIGYHYHTLNNKNKKGDP
jgi:hypothetical protein